ncbi:MAG: RNA polymerase sigma factor [Candidatus Binataceae bacterium]
MGSQPKLELPPPFEEAMNRHEREIMRFIVRSTHDREEALDLFQETWLRAYRAYPQLDSANGLRPWLFRIASNLCLNRRRDRMRHSRVIEAEDGNADVTADPNGGGHDAVMHLRASIERLPARQRQVLMMRKFAGLEYDEIATALGCSSESARAGVYQALKKLKAEL